MKKIYTRESETVFNWNPKEICGHITNRLGKTTATNTHKKCKCLTDLFLLGQKFFAINVCYKESAVLQIFEVKVHHSVHHLHVMTHQYINAYFSLSFALDTFYDVKWCHSHHTVNIQKKGQLGIFRLPLFFSCLIPSLLLPFTGIMNHMNNLTKEKDYSDSIFKAAPLALSSGQIITTLQNFNKKIIDSIITEWIETRSSRIILSISTAVQSYNELKGK